MTTTSGGPLRCVVGWERPADAVPSELDEYERPRLAALRRPEDRARFATGRRLARRLAGEELGVPPSEVELDATCPECGEPHGRPMVRGTDLILSIAHAGERVLVAVARGAAVGVDVELVGEHPDLMQKDAGVLAPSEMEALKALPEVERDAGFTALWTRKEAVLKALGVGLRIEPGRIVVTGPSEEPDVVMWPEGVPEHRLAMATLDLGEGYRACLAALTNRPLDLHLRDPDQADHSSA